MKEFLKAALIRAIRTFAQSLVSVLTVAKVFHEVDWLMALSAAGMTTLVSILMSVATGLPEAPQANKPEDETDDFDEDEE